MGLLISRTELFSQPAFLKKPFVFVVRYCHFSLINLLLLNYSTAAFRFTVINFFNYRFPTLFTYKESILFYSKFISLFFFVFFFPSSSSSSFSFLSLSSRLPPGHLSPLFLFSSQELVTEDVGQRLGTGPETSSLSCALPLKIHNIRGALVSMHPFSCHTWVFPFFFTLYLFLSYFLSSFNENKTIFVITYDAN